MQFVITIRGDKQQIARLQKLGQSIYSLRREMEEIGTLVKQYAAGQAMASQGGVLNATWPMLKSSYAVWKARHYPGRPPLVRTGRMSKQFQYEAKDTSVTITNAADYFRYHQTGTSNMPQRLSLAINNIQKRTIVQIIDAGIRRKIEAVS